MVVVEVSFFYLKRIDQGGFYWAHMGRTPESILLLCSGINAFEVKAAWGFKKGCHRGCRKIPSAITKVVYDCALPVLIWFRRSTKHISGFQWILLKSKRPHHHPSVEIASRRPKCRNVKVGFVHSYICENLCTFASYEYSIWIGGWIGAVGGGDMVM